MACGEHRLGVWVAVLVLVPLLPGWAIIGRSPGLVILGFHLIPNALLPSEKCDENNEHSDLSSIPHGVGSHKD